MFVYFIDAFFYKKVGTTLNYFQKKIVSGETYDYKSTILFKIYSLNTISIHITAAIIN
jgi:hypothetical protein